jgi:CRP-like cAMP-binding protein
MDTTGIRPLALFDGLDDRQLRGLVEQGHEVAFATGDEVFREGEPAEAWWVLLDGSVDLVRHVGREETVLGVMDAFIGIAVGGSGNIGAVAPGVAEALVTTVAGLAVAVPSVMAYNLFVNRLGLFAGELEGFAQEIIGTMAREGRL